jgi:hypothetical protein
MVERGSGSATRRRGKMMQGTKEHLKARNVPFGEVFGRQMGLLILECDCRARLVLDNRAVEHMGGLPLTCGICGERWRREEVRSLEE